MRIICQDKSEDKIGKALAADARAAGLQADVVRRQDAYALTIWSTDDAAILKDERMKSMSPDDLERFMEYAQNQVKADMTERGWESMAILLDLYLAEEGK